MLSSLEAFSIIFLNVLMLIFCLDLLFSRIGIGKGTSKSKFSSSGFVSLSPIMFKSSINKSVFSSTTISLFVLGENKAASDHIDHVKTQLPYALISGLITAILYLIIGFSY